MLADTVIELKFGRGGNAQAYLGMGWSAGEDGFRWMVDCTSELTLPNPRVSGDCIIELELHPFTCAPHLSAQRMTIAVGGIQIGHKTFSSGGLFGWRIPAEALSTSSELRLQLTHPDARRPSELGFTDDRNLALSVRSARLLSLRSAGRRFTSERATVLPTAQLVIQFESLGDNCEFGLVQRKCGQEPLGLLRFSNIEIPSLIHALRSGFAGLADLGALECWTHEINKEFVIRDLGYGITYHTFVHADQTSSNGILTQQATRLKFLARKLLEDVDNGEKIFVIKSNKPVGTENVLPLFCALCERGDNALLWVVPSDSSARPSTVEWLLPDLLQGVVTRFAPPENAHDFLLEDWLKVCGKAYAMLGVRRS